MYLLCVCVSRVLTRQKKRSLSRTENIKNTAQCAKKTGAESKCLNTAQSRQTLTWYIKNTAQCAKKTGAESKFLKYSAIKANSNLVYKKYSAMCKENRGRVQVLKIQRNPGGHPGVCAVFYPGGHPGVCAVFYYIL